MDVQQHAMEEVDITRDSKYNALELDFSTKHAMRIVCQKSISSYSQPQFYVKSLENIHNILRKGNTTSPLENEPSTPISPTSPESPIEYPLLQAIENLIDSLQPTNGSDFYILWRYAI
jgi:hypothetical protein